MFSCRYELYVKMASQELIQPEEQDKAAEQSEESGTADTATAGTDMGE